MKLGVATSIQSAKGRRSSVMDVFALQRSGDRVDPSKEGYFVGNTKAQGGGPRLLGPEVALELLVPSERALVLGPLGGEDLCQSIRREMFTEEDGKQKSVADDIGPRVSGQPGVQRGSAGLGDVVGRAVPGP